ncbi:MAG: SUMF1/EgtB/PvdO family nonheme iron enzyme [Longimicrobiales bacterium]
MADPSVVRRMMKQCRAMALCTLAAACATAAPPDDRAVAAPAQTYMDSIPGTLVRFEMTRVPAGRLPDGARMPAFDIGRTEATWDMYDVYALRLNEPARVGGADARARPSSPYGAPDYGWGHAGFPVMSVTRAAVDEFCLWLSERTGHRYRLPTESEWTYLAMLATQHVTADSAWRDAVAWHRGNSDDQTHAVAKKQPDALGLFDLFGNVAEWVVAADGALVTRGGSFRDRAETIGPASRAVQNPTWNERDPQLPKSRWWLSDGPFVGFRIVRETSPER